jgi:hypothetical protein
MKNSPILLLLALFYVSTMYVEGKKISLNSGEIEDNKLMIKRKTESNIYNEGGLRIEWTKNGDFQMDIPDDWDCIGECENNNGNKCDIGVCFELCYDRDKDFYITESEVQHALDAKLSWAEKMLTSNAKEWVNKFDNDGDSRISPLELYNTDKSKCGDLNTIYNYLCMRCKTYKKAIA